MLTVPLLAALACAPAQEPVRLNLVVDPRGIARPAVCPVRMHLPASSLPDGADLSFAPDWAARIEGDLRSRLAQARVTRGEDGAPTGLELAWHEYRLDPSRSHLRELVLTPTETKEGPGQHVLIEEEGARELRTGGQTLWRHELAWDPERHQETFRPYTHLYHPATGALLTKGPGGQHPHHRGVFCGWTRTKVGDQRHNFWSVPGEPRPHQEHRGWDVETEWTGPIFARVAALTDWIAADGQTVVRERREWDTWRINSGEELRLSYTITLTARGEQPVELDGDPAHAGFQVRLAQSVADAKACTYVLPDSATGGRNDNWSDAPWVMGRFPIGDASYELVFLDHPWNPTPTVFNTRDYGRFGPFFRATLAPGEPLTLRYALQVRKPPPEEAEPLVTPQVAWASWVTPVEVRVAE